MKPALVTNDFRSRSLEPAGGRMTVEILMAKLKKVDPSDICYICVDGKNYMALNDDRVLGGDHVLVLGWSRGDNDFPGVS